MAIASTLDLIAALRAGPLLETNQLEIIHRKLQANCPNPKSLAKELLRRGWLTAYQANQLLQGKGAELVLGQYVLLERLGEGGMGTVFKARHGTLDRIVALKLIRKERLKTPATIKRFHREVRAAAQLSHPNIVLAFDADEARGSHFLVMEYVEGTDLARLVRQQGPLPIAQACDCIRQTAEGLQHAYERGLVHRDIKPHNLLLTQHGVVKVLDMGLARLGEASSDPDATSALTQEGAVMGTPDYIAPEQALASHTVDIRADLYSLGCTFYYLLTGQVPFPGGSMTQKLLKHQLNEPTPVEKLRPEVPGTVAAVVRKLMAKRPEDRYQRPSDLAATLRALPTTIPTATPGPPAAEGRTLPAPTVPAYAADEAADTRVAVRLSRQAKREAQRKRWMLMNAAGGGALLVLLGLLVFLLSRSGDRSVGSRLAQGPTQPNSSDGPAGFVSLFNGKDLDGWEVQAGPAEDWVVRNGVLTCQATGISGARGWLGTRKTYRNFVFTAEWRVPPLGDSGIFIHAVPGPLRPNCPEIQAADDAFAGHATSPSNFSGGISNALAPTKQVFKGANQWNQVTITCRANRLTVVLNEETVVDVDRYQVPRLANQPLEGHIGLQNYGKAAEFRALYVRELPDGPIPTRPTAPWIALFNGTDLTGWEVKQGRPEDWAVEHNLLVCRGGMKGWLASRAAYRDFTLWLDWRLPAAGNSGVWLRASSPADHAVEVDMIPWNPGNPPGGTFGGDLWLFPLGKFTRLPIDRQAARPAGDWNTFVITYRGDRLSVVLNGETVNEADARRLPALGLVSGPGPIGLQNFGTRAEFRSIFIQDQGTLAP